MPVFNNILAGASGVTEASAFQIDRSLRFNKPDGSELLRTPTSAGNRRTFTHSFWAKRSSAGSQRTIFSGNTSGSFNNGWQITIENADTLSVNGASPNFNLTTSRVLRDQSAWYHIVVSTDTTQATASNRLKIYINGEQVTDLGTSSYPSQNDELNWNGAFVHQIGGLGYTSSVDFDGYLADVYFIDGQALAPTDFGEYDDDNNWNPKAYSGTYGTNGFHLDFSDNSSNAALGNDSSGNNNDWTVNNLVAIAGLETASQGFDVVTYSGNGTTQSISSLEFQPDFVWIKCRNDSVGHQLFDSVRGAGKSLLSNTTEAERTNHIYGYLSAFTSDGFTVTAGSSDDFEVNGSAETYVAWCWKAGGTASSNTDGSITSSVSANTTYGFSIVSYSGANSVSTVGHGLGAAPEMFVVKRRSPAGYGWITYHSALGASKMMALQNTSAAALDFDPWDQTAPTSSVFTVNTTGSGTVNASGADYIAYCWSEVSGFSKFGSYTGNGSSTGPTITTGFKPRFLLIKNSDNTDGWSMWDSARNPSNPVTLKIEPNSGGAEGSNSVHEINFLDDGFQILGTWAGHNGSGNTMIYAAFADKPPGEIIDSLIDTPTNYEASSGNNGGNYATLNPLSKGSAITLANGNLDISAASSGSQRAWGTIGVSTGKWYFEFTQTSGTYAQGVGIKHSAAQDNNDNYFYTGHTGQKVNASGTASSYGATWGINDVIGVAFDLDAGTITFYKNGVSQGQAFSGITDATYFPYVAGWSGGTWGGVVNFGARPFAYTPPSNHLPLVTTNLPDPTIADGSTAMDAVLYTGNGTSQTISGLGFSPDWVWTKLRSAGFGHRVWDTVRGATKRLEPHATTAEATESTALTAFTSDGFSVGSESNVNTTYLGGEFVAWCWDGGTSTASNTNGSITSNVRANASAGFSIVSWTGSGSGSTTVGHGLNAAPYMFIVKDRSNARNWLVYHIGMGATKGMQLNLTSAQSGADAGYWNNTAPTSTTISLGTYANESANYIAYCFTPVAGYSAFGSYTGNGSSDGTFVYLGFRPKFLLWKNTSAVANWYIYDSARSTYNVVNVNLEPNTSDAERTLTSMNVDFLSNGYKIRGSDGDINGSGSTYVYAAFAENPFKTARAA